MLMSSSMPPLSLQSLLGCNDSSLQGRGGLLMLYTVDKVQRQVYIITGIYSISIFPPTFITPYRSSCNAVIQCYYRNSAPPYLGFNAEEYAQTLFVAFQASGQLPAGLFPTSLRLLNDSLVPSSQSPLPLTPPHRGMTQASGQVPAGLISQTSLRPLSDSPVPSFQSPLLLTPHHRGITRTSPFSHTVVRAAPQMQGAFTPQTTVHPAPQMSNSVSTSNSPHHDPSSIVTPLSPM